VTRRNEHLAAHVSAFLLARQLILEMHARCAGLDHGLHQLERVQRPTEPSLRVRDDRREPVRPSAALGPRDLVGALQRVVDAPDEPRNAVRRIERLIRVGVSCDVRVGGDLPPGDVDRVESRLDHLDGLPARERAERGNGLAAPHE
jgi:hypothetical protein